MHVVMGTKQNPSRRLLVHQAPQNPSSPLIADSPPQHRRNSVRRGNRPPTEEIVGWCSEVSTLVVGLYSADYEGG